MCEMWSNGVETAFFQNITKKCPAAGGFAPDPSQWYVWITVRFFTKHVFQCRHFYNLTIGLSSPPERVPSYVQTPGTASDLLFYDILAHIKNSSFEVFDDVICTWFWFGPLPIKNLGYAYGYHISDTGILHLLILWINCLMLVPTLNNTRVPTHNDICRSYQQ